MSRYIATSIVAAVAISAGVYFYVRSSKATKATKPSISKQEEEAPTQESTTTQASAPASEVVKTPAVTETPVATPVTANVSLPPPPLSFEVARFISFSPNCRSHQLL